MTITFFETLGPVIDKSVEFAAKQLGLSTAQIYERIVAETDNNQAEWFSNRVPNLNYRNQDCRLAYLYIVATANANTFKQVLTVNDEIRNYILQTATRERALKICAFGAGPGTELLGLAKFLCEQNLGFSVSVDFQLLDKVKEWANSWFGIRDELRNTFKRQCGLDHSQWPMIPAGNLLECDVTDLGQLPHLGNVWDQDLYVVNFLLSEIFDDDPGLRAFLSEVASVAPTGAKFVFIERRGSMWCDRMNNIASDAGLDLSSFIELRSDKLDRNEKPENLGAIYAGIGGRKSPRKSYNVVYSIGTKR